MLYLYASRDASTEQTIPAFLACLSRQIADLLNRTSNQALTTLRRHLTLADMHSVSGLQAFLCSLSKEFSCVYTVLDGLDEFSEDPDQRGALVASLTLVARETNGEFRICVLSRDGHLTYHLSQPPWMVDIRASHDDIASYVDDRISGSLSLLRWMRQDNQLRSAIMTTVMEKSGLMYGFPLWSCSWNLAR